MIAALRRPLILIPLLLVALVLLYLAAGAWLVPKLVRDGAQDYVGSNLKNKAVALGKVHFSPFSLALDIDNIVVSDTRTPADAMVSIQHLLVDVSASSILHLAPRLDAVVVDAPTVNAVLRKDGTINLAELVPPDDGTPIPDVVIDRLVVSGGSASFVDARAAAPQRKDLKPISFKLDNFATRTDAGGGFNLDAASADGEKFHWDGKLSMAPLASTGRFRIDALKLTSLYKFAADSLPVVLSDGVLDIAGDYIFSAPPKVAGKAVTTQLEANLSRVALANLALRSKDGDDVTVKTLTLAPTQLSVGSDRATLGAVALTGLAVQRRSGERAGIDSLTLAPTQVALTGQSADVGALALTGLAVQGRGKAGATVALGSISVAPSRIDAKAQNARIGTVTLSGLQAAAVIAADNSISIPGLYPMVLPKSAPAAAKAGPPWHYSLAGLKLDDAALRLTLAKARPAKVIDLAPVTLEVGEVNDALNSAIPVSVSARINRSAAFSAKGNVNPGSGAADLAIDLNHLQLADFAALAPLPPTVALKSALLDVKGRVAMANSKAGPSFAGNVSVANLDLKESGGGDLLKWARMDMGGIRYAAAPARLAVGKISIDRLVSQVTIARDTQINVMRAAGQSAAVAAAPVGKPAIGKVRVKAVMSNTLASTGAMIPVSIGAVEFKGGTIGFSDLSVEPQFNASIKGFAGTVSGLSTTPGSQARFNLKGYVIDRFSPVKITGRANPFAYDANTDITASFNNIELPVFNPYSGTYAGYAIAKGKLSTTLHYKINNRALDAQHHVVIDQLTWGDATANKPKVSMPVRMATSLLKDKNGVIDLDLPVAGTLDDPEFKVWPVIWQIVGNVFTKIITAPFKLIGSLFGGGEEAQFVAFAPGSAVLAPEAGASLGALAKGLAERPEVNLDLPAGPGIREDADAMTQAGLETAALAAAKKPPATYAELEADKKADRLKTVYKAKFGKKPDFPKDIPTANFVSSKETKHAAAEAETKWLEAQLLPKFAPSDADLAALGQARADAVKQALLADGSLQPTRVFVSTATSVIPKDGKVAMELAVK